MALTLRCWAAHVVASLHRRAEEARRAGVVAEERRRLLEQAADLADFLPPGVLKDRSELALMRQRAGGGSVR